MRYRFSFEWARGSNSDILLDSCPNDIKFWQMIGLTSGLIWYFIKKVGFLLKKWSFCRFTKKKASEGEVRVKRQYLSCLLAQMTSNWKYIKDKDRRWHTEEMDSFSTHKSHQKLTVTSKRLSKYVCGSKWVFLVNRQKLPFFNKKLNFYIE